MSFKLINKLCKEFPLVGNGVDSDDWLWLRKICRQIKLTYPNGNGNNYTPKNGTGKRRRGGAPMTN